MICLGVFTATMLSGRLLVADTGEHSERNYADPMDCGHQCYANHLAGSWHIPRYTWAPMWTPLCWCLLWSLSLLYEWHVLLCRVLWCSVSCECIDNDHRTLHIRCRADWVLLKISDLADVIEICAFCPTWTHRRDCECVNLGKNIASHRVRH